MKMLLVYLYCNLGGVATVFKHRLRVLRQAGISVDAAFAEDAGGSADWRRWGVKVHVFGRDFARAVARLVQDEEYDVVTVVDTPQAVRAIRPRYSGRLIYEVHTPILSVMMRGHGTDALCDLIVVPSQWSKRTLVQLGWRPERITVVPNVLDVEVFSGDHPFPPPGDSKVVMWVGKLADYKNWRDAVSICAKLGAARDDVSFRFVTGGTTTDDVVDELTTRLMESRIDRRLEWLHNVILEDMPSLYLNAAASGGALLSSSDAESFCMVVNEAFECGLPVVASRVGGLEDYAEHGVNALLFEPHRIYQAVDSVNEVLTRGELRDSLTRAARRTLARFRESRGLERYLTLLRAQ